MTWDMDTCSYACPPPPPALFTVPFCHPRYPLGYEGTSAEQIWNYCAPSTPPDECTGNRGSGCALDYGASLIQDKDFCAVAWSNPDVTQIVACQSIQDQSHCSSKQYCKWYKGKTVSGNVDLVPNSKLFHSNFCHPPSINIAHWDVVAPNCLSEMNQGACEGKGCVWSTGSKLAPEGDFCNVEYITQDA
jgi:hypothetical protein